MPDSRAMSDKKDQKEATVNVSLILLFLAMWVLGHAASTSTKRNHKLVNFRRRRSHGDAAASPHENTGCWKADAANSVAELLAKADRYTREGKPLEARLCRKAALELDAIDRDRSQRSGIVAIEPVDPTMPLRSERNSAAA